MIGLCPGLEEAEMHSSGASFLPTGKGFSLHPYLVLPFNWGDGEGGGGKYLWKLT